MPIQITKIEFKAKRIVFEINGGGKKGKKWYQRIQIGTGGTARPDDGAHISNDAAATRAKGRLGRVLLMGFAISSPRT